MDGWKLKVGKFVLEIGILYDFVLRFGCAVGSPLPPHQGMQLGRGPISAHMHTDAFVKELNLKIVDLAFES